MTFTSNGLRVFVYVSVPTISGRRPLGVCVCVCVSPLPAGFPKNTDVKVLRAAFIILDGMSYCIQTDNRLSDANLSVPVICCG